jgi:hypothetical protein
VRVGAEPLPVGRPSIFLWLEPLGGGRRHVDVFETSGGSFETNPDVHDCTHFTTGKVPSGYGKVDGAARIAACDAWYALGSLEPNAIH